MNAVRTDGEGKNNIGVFGRIDGQHECCPYKKERVKITSESFMIL